MEKEDEEAEENSWEDYFSAKKAKLNAQFNSPQNTNGKDVNYPKLFEGVTIYINGYTNPPDPELRVIFTNHGGQYSQYFGSSITFVIATTLPLAKKKLMSGKTLRSEWITESVKAGYRLDYRKYFLYDANAENNQKTLTQIVQKQNLSVPTEVDDSFTTRRRTRRRVVQSGESSTPSLPSADREVEDSVRERDYCDMEIPEDQSQEEASNFDMISDFAAGTKNFDSPKTSSLMSTSEEGFLEAFYNKSRLHLISTMKKETQQMVAGWRRNANTHDFALRHEYLADMKKNSQEDTPSNEAVVFHIDMDCFFVSVGRLTRPHLIGMAVAVTHSKGTGPGSKSEIACVSYEGRAKGVSAGMWLDEAKRLCPELQTIPYEFEEYKRISRIFFETVASMTLDIEPISCDELYCNASTVLADSGTTPRHLAEFLRNSIKTSSKIAASIGIGNSKLSARIATRLAKENGDGIREMSEPELKEYVLTLPVRKLPGVGYATTEKLNDVHKIETCGDLQHLSLEELKQSFGGKTGEKLYWLSRGVDKDPLQCDTLHHQAKSISAGCSFGVRFSTMADINSFIKQLSSELSKRANESECYGKKMTLSLWIVRKGYINVPVKPGAHGVVDIHSRTRPFHIHTRDANVICSMSNELVRSITKTSIPPNYIRGVRISLDNLRYEFDITEKEKKSIQGTLLSTFSSKSKQGTSSSTGVEFSQNSSTVVHSENEICPRRPQQEIIDDATLKSEEIETATSDFVSEIVDAEDASKHSFTTLSEALPFLNGVNSITDVKQLIHSGNVSKYKPTHEDTEILTSYLHDLLNANNLKEGNELIFHIWGVIREIVGVGGDRNLAWASTFIRMLKNTETLIFDKYGDNLYFPG